MNLFIVDVCNTYEYSNRDLFSITIDGVDKSDALLGSGAATPPQGSSGDVLLIEKNGGLPFGVGTVISITVEGATKISLLSPESQEVSGSLIWWALCKNMDTVYFRFCYGILCSVIPPKCGGVTVAEW